MDNAGNSIASGTGQTTVVVGGSTATSVPLVAGPSACGNGVLDPIETCDDGNRFSFDGCDFRCHVENEHDAGMLPDAPTFALDGTMAGAGDVAPNGAADVAAREVTLDLLVTSDLSSPRPEAAQDGTPDLPGDSNADVVDAPRRWPGRHLKRRTCCCRWLWSPTTLPARPGVRRKSLLRKPLLERLHGLQLGQGARPVLDGTSR